MKLDIYNKKEIVKSYEADKYSIMFGTLREFIKIVNLDDIKSGSDDEIMNLVIKALPNSIDLINHLIKDIFDGITDEELDNVRIKDIVILIVEILKYSMVEMSAGIKQKN